MAIDPGLLEPYERLIRVTIEGRVCQVPEKNTLLRALQYLDIELYACRLCWNGECDNCRFRYLDPAGAGEVSAKGCETRVFEGMVITRLPQRAAWPSV